MKKLALPVIGLFLLAITAQLDARGISIWSYAKLRNCADFVVIAKTISNTDTKDVFLAEKDGYTGVNTEFEVLDVSKGDVDAKKITVLHFKNAPGSSHMDGALTIHFRIKTLAETAAEMHPEHLQNPEARQVYILFLKKRNDGRYEPVTGQLDSSLSAKEINEPPWNSTE
ncbi:MAG: hypothetical protein WCD79_02835 [Chthoniobacteraceae bacterium]